MKVRCAGIPWPFVALTLASSLAVIGLVRAEDVQRVRAQFAQPPREYSSAPLWVWNDRLTEDQIASTMEDLAGQHVRQVFVHPRPGLMTPYLSDEWFRLWRRALREAERLDMNVWIYDENSYPSGFAGGLVSDAMPEARGMGLAFSRPKTLPTPSDDVLAVFRKTADGYEDMTVSFRQSDLAGPGPWLVATIRHAPMGGWFGGKFYVDLLQEGVTEKFLDVTLEAYRRELGDQFGRRIPGSFTDEPHLAPAGGLHWSPQLPDWFHERWGYDLVDHLPSLAEPVGDWRRVRHNYYQLLLERFIDRWAKPYYEYCERHDLEFTGHYWEHGWPGAGHGGDNMAMYAWHQRPAIDILMNQYSEDVHAQFGNVRSVVELASVANQLGRRRTLCEAYGAGGWDLRFEDMKRIGDWIYVLGVNTLDEHLSYITIRGARKRDHPQSFSYHEPWWEAYHALADYFTRLSLVLSSGEQRNDVLVLEPTTTTWMYQNDGHLNELGQSFQKLVTDLAQRQVEFDLGCEDIMARHGTVDGAALVIGERRYGTVVLPPMTENLNEPTWDLLIQYAAAGGRLIYCDDLPTRLDGGPTDLTDRLAKQSSCHRVAVDRLVGRLQKEYCGGVTLAPSADSQGILYHQRRQLDSGQFVFLVNTSMDAPVDGTVRGDGRSIEVWDLFDGTVRPYAFIRDNDQVTATFHLPPCGSLLLWFSRENLQSRADERVQSTAVSATGPVEVVRDASNVLTLDYVDITLGDTTRQNVYFYEASREIFRHHGMDGNPWDSAVQFRDELIRRTFPDDSGFQATYRFTIRDRVPENIEIVMERPDLYSIQCNGKPVKAMADAWWLDRSFGRIDLAEAARVGENQVTLFARPMTMYHELEPAYVLGDFSLKPEDRGFVVVPDRGLTLADKRVPRDDRGWNRQGHPFYGAGVTYRQAFRVDRLRGQYVVELGDWNGSVASVRVNGQLAGYLVCRPWECDVTEWMKEGENFVEVTVIGTLKNTLGPHHAGELRGAAWPHMFRKAPQTGPPPGRQYDTIGYGLFEPFQLICRKKS